MFNPGRLEIRENVMSQYVYCMYVFIAISEQKRQFANNTLPFIQSGRKQHK